MKFSILDQGLIDKNTSSEQALSNTIELAKNAEKLGYFSFWVSEHHNVHSFSISCPEIVMMQLAQQTKNLKIGVASILLNLYSALRTAETINTMTTFFKDRFLFSLGSNPGTKLIQQAFNYSSQNSLSYQQKIKELFHYLNLKTKKSSKKVRSVIQNQANKEIFITTFTLKNAILAAKLGANLIIAHNLFPNFLNTKKIIKIYRKTFEKYWPNKQSQVIFPSFIVTSTTKTEIQKLATPLKFFLLGENDFNKYQSFPTWEDVSTRLHKEAELDLKSKIFPLIGSAKYILDELEKIANDLEIDHFLLIPMVNQIENRIKILELIANEFKRRQNAKIC
ncbi:MsnO8 family LLM class oxidoreductase [Mesomycoplasma hyorhinis]|uniref:Luciferase-like monooxygenase n=2 Tax=Mesomycoplasma hyorhinis TaxID=2100 RepID=A0AAI8FDI6_MESHY|nr:MsnO8 family LLM class oxidoreductase [Mesomycoplasma hyorhinis]AEC45669.1 hypothetical protein SRH_00490 [Mesomycoplasma hyorhinis MCLD]AEX14077.1 luciferase family oxidoreductase [Mesomycoplasma hyorhinis GDL-1]AFX74245.1 Luciferase-like monooxygenase [Mesomycoplasma hyorhinis SK76]AHA41070.1 luciferase oxidoreductase, group 1 family protein [Mesomycoplasma hyorhinis DBS 1050]AOD25303.1 luciferase family oxidoreductase [Mesomycoplasma hyorhinis]